MNANLYCDLLPPGKGSEQVMLIADNGVEWTRAKIEDLAGRIARLLRGSGIGFGDSVAVQVDKSAEAICLYLACLKIGAVFVPLNSAYTELETEQILADAVPRAFVGHSAARAPAAGQIPDLAVFDLTADGGGSLIAAALLLSPITTTAAVGSDDLAAILYTSGTTGRPKGAMITHGNLAFSTTILTELWGIGEADIVLHALPVFHAHGLFIAINTALHARATTLFLSKFSVDSVIDRLPRATIFMGVPTLYLRLLADPRLTQELCGNMRLFTCGSAPLSVETFNAFEARTGHRILERYGMTETAIIASNPLDGQRLPGTVGYELPGVEVRVRDSDGGDLAPKEIGELAVRGPNVFKGYWRMPERSSAEFTPDGFFRTGDLAKILPDGRIVIVGRSKDLIISGGYNVYPSEIEAAIARIGGIRDSAVIGVPHPDFGEGVIAVIERTLDAVALEPRSVIAKLARDLAHYKLPKIVIIQDNLPRNAMGKLQKNELRRLHALAFQSDMDRGSAAANPPS